ncbi:probable histone H2A.3 [Penaeus monodon]|uniref:probable histone H2A.3 n=1 Tax=Penaeus monodon TaxID=6687 RepID=UPI0018A6DADB|nr:probable histone H2A.3 [Penaeus monodon]
MRTQKVKKSTSKAAEPVRRQRKEKRAGLILPVGRMERQLRAGQWNPRTSPVSAVYIAAALEHVLRRILAQSMAWADAMQRVRVTPLFVALAVKADPELDALLGDVMFKDARPADYILQAVL